MKPDLSIVVPCYNEEKNIPLIVERFSQMLTNNNFEVLLVNNGSTDHTGTQLDKDVSKLNTHKIRVVTVKENKGYGFGILAGLKEAKAEVLAWTHADMQTDPFDVLRAYEHYVQRVQTQPHILVKGKRVKRPWLDWAFTFCMAIIASFALRRWLNDINAQPKLFSRDFYNKMTNPPWDFSLDLYLLYLAKVNHYTITTFPVEFKPRIHGESKWAFSFSSKWKTIMRSMKYIFSLRKAVIKQ